MAKARTKLAEAKAAVERSRSKYEEAMRDLVVVRQAGFPELKCPAPVREDRFPMVPTIAAADLGEPKQTDQLGKGSFASVYQVELPLVGPCAFKKLEGLVDRNALMREAAAMWDVRHCEDIVRLLMVCDEPKQLGLVLELAEAGRWGRCCTSGESD